MEVSPVTFAVFELPVRPPALGPVVSANTFAVQRALTSLTRRQFGVPEATGATNGPSVESTVYLNTYINDTVSSII